jgi:hypothetical protein
VGEVTIDPADGSIVRLALKADMEPANPFLMADVMIEYGPEWPAPKTHPFIGVDSEGKMCAAYQCHVACHRATMPYKRFGRDTGVSGMADKPTGQIRR